MGRHASSTDHIHRLTKNQMDLDGFDIRYRSMLWVSISQPNYLVPGSKEYGDVLAGGYSNM